MVVAHRVSSAIVVHRNRDDNTPKVHCPKAGRHVEKQHHMMNRRAECVVGGTVRVHAKAHHHERRGPHTMSKPSVAPPTPNQQLPSGRHMLIRPPQHDTWPGKPSTVLVCCTCQYTETTTLHRVSYVIERHQRQMPIPRLLLMGRTSYEREHMAQSRGKRV